MSETISIFPGANVPRPVSLGDRGEALAARFLERTGLRIVVTNFKVPVGRNSRGAQVTGEIDIIALEGETLVFVEVKTRRSDEFADVITAVDLRKQRQITRTARAYRRVFGIREIEIRFDVVTVLMPKYSEPVITHTRSYWTEAKFRKRNWHGSAWNEFA